MTFLDPAAVEREVRHHGLTMNDFFGAAEINKSTWHRWVTRATSPNTSTLERVQDALTDLPAIARKKEREREKEAQAKAREKKKR